MDDTIDNAIKQLRSYRDKYFEVMDQFDAGNMNVYMTDLLYRAAMKRSMALHRGFCDLMQARNFTCAAALVRLQLDNCLRVVALDFVADQSGFVGAVMSGEQIDKMKATSGRRLTDKFLCDKIALQHPWINTLYKDASGYIHLSEKHILAAFRFDSANEDAFNAYIGDHDPLISSDDYLKAIGSFARATELFFAIVSGWGSQIRAKYGDNQPKPDSFNTT